MKNFTKLSDNDTVYYFSVVASSYHMVKDTIYEIRGVDNYYERISEDLYNRLFKLFARKDIAGYSCKFTMNMLFTNIINSRKVKFTKTI